MVAHVVCQVVWRPSQITFIWSQEDASFAPYHVSAGTFRLHALEARRALSRAVRDESAIYALAASGHQLYQALFPADNANAAKVKDWLQSQTVDSLEIVSDRPGLVPWNLVYDQPPTDAVNLDAFWGRRHALSMGRRINALRATPLFLKPGMLLVGQADLPDAANAEVERVTSFEQLLRSLQAQVPDILCIEADHNGAALIRGDETLTLRDLRTAIDRADAGNPEPIVLLYPVKAWPDSAADGAADEEAGFLEGAASLFPGLITYSAGKDIANAPSALALLSKVLKDDMTAGGTLRELRRQHGVALLAAESFCPANLLITFDEATQLPPSKVSYELPAEPYKPLMPYDDDDWPLFAGRELEINRFADVLDASSTRLVVLNGSIGVGKSSFLRAGLIPLLNDHSIGYDLLRDRTQPSSRGPVLALRANRDITGQLAQGLCAFASQPFEYTSPTGETIRVPLPDLLSNLVRGREPVDSAIQSAASNTPGEAPAVPMVQTPASEAVTSSGLPAVPDLSVGESESSKPASMPAPRPPMTAGDTAVSPGELWEAMQHDVTLFGRILESLTRELPFELVLLIEQGEEMFWPQHQNSEIERRKRGLSMLAELARSTSRCKVVLAMRSEFLSLFLEHWSATGLDDSLKTFLLPPLTEEQLEQAMLLPCSAEPLPYTRGVPFEKYGFTFADGFVSHVVERVMETAEESGLSAAAILQAVCHQLLQRKARTVGKVDLRAIQGVRSAYDRLVTSRVEALLVGKSLRRRFWQLLEDLVDVTGDGYPMRARSSMEDCRRTLNHPNPVLANEALDRAAEPENSLLQFDSVIVAGKERPFGSLASDTLAQYLQRKPGLEKHARAYATTRVIDTLWIMIPLMFLSAAVAYFFTHRSYGPLMADMEALQGQLKKAQPIAETLAKLQNAPLEPSYVAHIAQAHDAWQNNNLIAMRQALLTQQYLPRSETQTDPRGFAWYYLWHLANSERARLEGHASTVTTLAVSGDGKLLASGSTNGRLKIWDLDKNIVRAELRAQQGPAIRVVAFSADRKSLFVGGADKSIHVYEVPADDVDFAYLGEPAQQLKGHDDAIVALALHDNRLASASANGELRFWNLGDKNKVVHTTKVAAINILRFSPDGKTLVAGGAKSILFFDAQSGKQQRAFDLAGPVSALALSPDGKILASGSSVASEGVEVGTIRLWNVETAKPQGDRTFEHGSQVFALAFGPDNNTLYSSGRDRVVRIWDTAKASELGTLKGHLGWISALALTPDGKTLVTGSYDADIRVWDPQPSSDNQVVHAGANPVTAVAVSPDSELLVWGDALGVVELWDMRKQAPISVLKAPKGLTHLSLGGTGPYKLCAVSKDPEAKEKQATLILWSLKDSPDKGSRFDLTEILNTKVADLTTAVVASEGDLFASAEGNLVMLRDTVKGEITSKLEGPTAAIRCLAFSGDGKIVAAGSDDKTIRYWKTSTGMAYSKSPLKGHSGSVLSLSLVGSHYFCSTSADNSIRLWDIEKGEQLRSLQGHAGPMRRNIIDPRSGVVFTPNSNGSVILWNPIAGEQFQLHGHRGPVHDIALARAGQTLVSAGADGTVRLWLAPRPQQLRHK